MPDPKCNVAGCDRSRYAQQPYCEPHYRRLRRTGSLDPERAIGATVEPKRCMVDSCSNPSTERGLCHGHYLRLIRVGELQPDRPLSRRVNDICRAEGCERDAEARGLCHTHAHRQRKYGDVQADKPIRSVPGTGYESHGYRYVPVAKHLRHLSGGRTPFPEHRLRMAKILGRPLTRDESVHHVNGIGTDNRTDGPLRAFRSGNLELWSRSQPSGQRVVDKIAWAIEMLELYAPEALAPQLPLFIDPARYPLARRRMDGRRS
jgi:hypothetical protein